MLEYATFLGDNGEDMGRGVAIDGEGKVYVTGGTASADFPVTADALDSTLGGDRDAFLVIFSSGGCGPLYASFLGGSARDEAYAVAFNPTGLYLTGLTFSADFPTSEGSYDTSHNGDYDVYVTAYTMSDEPPPLTCRLHLPAVIR